MFLTQEKALTRIHQDRQKGDLKKALKRALEATDKWPDDFNLAIEAIQLCFDLSDFKQSVTLMKTALRKHPGSKSQIMGFARETLAINFNPFLCSFIIEVLLRSRNIEEIRDLLRTSPDSYIESMIKRGENRSAQLSGTEGAAGAQNADNELLLGLLYIQCGRYSDAAVPLGTALAGSPSDAVNIGELLLEIEREVPDDALVKFNIGLVSIMVAHPEKAQPRFFQCIELRSPPLEKILNLLESLDKELPDHLLLKGELLIRMARKEEGIPLISEYCGSALQHQPGEGAHNRIEHLEERRPEGRALAMERLSKLLETYQGDRALTFLFCEIAVPLGRLKETVEALEMLVGLDPQSCPAIISWIDEHEEMRGSAPSQKLLTFLYLDSGDYARMAESARLAAEMNPSQINSLIEMIEKKSSSAQGKDMELLAAAAELHALNGNSEKAESLLHDMESGGGVDENELLRLTGCVIEKCGMNMERVGGMVEYSVNNGNMEESVPYALQFYRQNTGAHGEFAACLESIAGEDSDRWAGIGELIERLSEDEELTRPVKLILAKSHMNTGQIEKAIFEFDQLMMFDESLRFDLIPVYEKAAGKHPLNTTLNLALYQIHLEVEQFSRASHYLGKALESDPSQIRDVIPKFEGLTRKDPANRIIWEEMLDSALAMNHLDLAREILKRALSALPEDSAAALHVYGARISAADGKSVDSLRCLALALTSGDTDLFTVQAELEAIIAKEPLNAEARYLCGETLLRIGKEDESVAQLEKCIELSSAYIDKVGERLESLLPMSIKPWLISRILGEIAWKSSNPQDAYRYFNNAQKGPAESLRGLNDTLGRLHGSFPDQQRLASIYARGLALEGRYTESSSILGGLFDKYGDDTGRIMEILLEIVERDPLQFEANRLLAAIWVAAGEGHRSLQPVLNMIACEGIPPEDIDASVAEFLDIHRADSRFLIPYAGLRVRAGDHRGALDRYWEAFEADRSCWETIASGIREREWPGRFNARSALMVADCMLEGSWVSEAYETLRSIQSPDRETTEKIIERLYRIIELQPSAEYFYYGCDLNVGTGDLEGAGNIVRLAGGKLSVEETVDLKIRFAELLEESGRPDRASDLYREILDDCDDREPVLRRIENAYSKWVSRELEDGMISISEGKAGEDRKLGLIRTAIDAGEFGKALEMIDGSGLPRALSGLLRASAYLGMDRPSLALFVAGSLDRTGLSEENMKELCYVEGIACETVGDYGRAAAAFMKIIGTESDYRDSRRRAERNYGLFIGSQIDDGTGILTRTGELNPAYDERKES